MDIQCEGRSFYVVYSNVVVGNEANLYRIQFTHKTGNLSLISLETSSTHDKYKDEFSSESCTEVRRILNAYIFCINRNPPCTRGPGKNGMEWKQMVTVFDSLERSQLKLRRP